MFEAVFFDMDGLFIDSEPQWHEAEADLIKSFGYPWSAQDQLHCLGGPLSRVGEYMSKCLNGSEAAEKLADLIVQEMIRRMSGDVALMPGAIEFSKSLNDLGLPQALVSASSRPIVDAVLKGMKEKYFRESVAAGDIERTKPYPDPYLHAAALLGVDIRNCLIFEDSPTGLTAARASGAFVVGIPHHVVVEEEPRLKVVTSFLEIGKKQLDGWFAINQRERDRSL
jgi:HAD superfamily hydrolase (TIGR01509 family)